MFDRVGNVNRGVLLVGEWKLAPDPSMFSMLHIKATKDGLEVSSNDGGNYSAKFDGKDYPFRGSPMFDSITLQPISTRSFREIKKKNGRVVNVNVVEVSTNGKELTHKIENPKGGSEEVVISYRQ